LKFAQAFDFARDDEVFILAQRDAMLGGETFRAFSYEIYMRTLTQNFTGGAHWIAQTLDAAYASGAQGCAFHDERVELHFAVAIEEAAASGIEGLVVFHDHDGFFDGVERGAAAAQYLPACGLGVADSVEVSLDHVIWNGPGASVDNQNRISGQKDSSRDGLV
jgi:hypothetical protein